MRIANVFRLFIVALIFLMSQPLKSKVNSVYYTAFQPGIRSFIHIPIQPPALTYDPLVHHPSNYPPCISGSGHEWYLTTYQNYDPGSLVMKGLRSLHGTSGLAETLRILTKIS